MTRKPLFLGIDLGTGGVRALAVDAAGTVVARGAAGLAEAAQSRQGSRHEQSPLAWWQAVCLATQQLVDRLRHIDVPRSALAAVAVDGTSGTLVAVDAQEQPLRAALMYNDGRADIEAAELNQCAGDWCQQLGYRFDASYTLAKALWLARHEGAVFEQAARLRHQADFITVRLGADDAIDSSNALKTGFDLIAGRWPAWFAQLPGILEKLPRVVAPGSPIGEVTPAAAVETHLPAGLPIVAGATDGTAGCLASGLHREGDYNTTLGTTLVFKGLARQAVRHPKGLIYSHQLPGGWWLPGAASNTGGAWIRAWFGDCDLVEMDRQAAARLPTPTLAWPLLGCGERFPLWSPQAQGFLVPSSDDPHQRYAACLQGTALVERLAYEVLDQALGTRSGAVYATGGGAASDVWMQCRSDVTGRVFQRPACPESAFGSAILAALGVEFGELSAAMAAMVHVERSFEPAPERAGPYQAIDLEWRSQLSRHGFDFSR